MIRCLQELCSHWSGAGDVCPCAIDGRELPRCPDCGEPHDPDVCAATSSDCDCCRAIAEATR